MLDRAGLRVALGVLSGRLNPEQLDDEQLECLNCTRKATGKVVLVMAENLVFEVLDDLFDELGERKN